MIKLLSLFTGIGAFEKALERLNVEYELVGFSEIDKYAIKSYCAIHNVTEDKNYGDISKIDENKLPNFDIMTWGFPCQDNMKKRGRVGKEVSQTILTSPNMAVVENANKPICLNANKNVSIQDRIYDEEGIAATVTASEFRSKIAERKMFNPYNNKDIKDIAPTQTANCSCSTSSAAVLISEDGKNYLKIRKLTPLECWRLMGFDDEDFYNAKNAGISDTQLYKQAGNSIVVDVLQNIFGKISKVIG